MWWAALFFGTATFSGVYNWSLITDDWHERHTVATWAGIGGGATALAVIIALSHNVQDGLATVGLVGPLVWGIWAFYEMFTAELAEKEEMTDKLQERLDTLNERQADINRKVPGSGFGGPG